MSIFIASLAFTDYETLGLAKTGIVFFDPEKKEDFLFISGTKMRALARAGALTLFKYFCRRY